MAILVISILKTDIWADMNDLEKAILNYLKSVRRVPTLTVVKTINNNTLSLTFGNDILQIVFDWNKKSITEFYLPQTILPKKEGNMIKGIFIRTSQSELINTLSFLNDKITISKIQQLSQTIKNTPNK